VTKSSCENRLLEQKLVFSPSPTDNNPIHSFFATLEGAHMKVLTLIFVMACVSCAAKRGTGSSQKSHNTSEDSDQSLPSDNIPIPVETEEGGLDETATSNAGGAAALTGVWQTDCFLSGGFASISTIESDGNSGRREITYYSDTNCTAAISNWVWEYSKLVVGEKVPGLLSGNQVEVDEMDVTYASTTLTILTQAQLDAVVDLDDDYYFTDKELRTMLNVPLDVSGRAYGTATQAAKGSTKFGSFAILDKNFYWSCCGATRTTNLVQAIYHKVQ
jgi:hypothetical protein